MKMNILKKIKALLLLGLIFALANSCERNPSDNIELAIFPQTGEIYTDAPIGMGTDFYFPYGGSKPTAWSVDSQNAYEGTSSMRFDVPNANDPDGNYAGAIFRIDGEGSGRNLTEFDALTFYAKASQVVSIGEIGFGEDFGENKYVATKANLQLTTNWEKYTIPIPDPMKLVQERGMMRYSAGGIGEAGSEVGYTFWIDELKFEKLGTVAQPQPAMLNGEDVEETTFLNSTINLSQRGLTQTYNLSNGQNQTVIAAPSYFTFECSDNDVAQVSELGIVTIVGSGTATITASMGGVKAAGSLSLETIDDFDVAPIPTRPEANVISIFSDAYTNVPVDFFNGYWEPFQTTESEDFEINGDHILNYTNFNFVGNQFANPTVDASQKSNVHINMYIPGEVPADMDFLITIVDFGSDGVDGGDDDTREQIFFDKAIWTANNWITLEFPITTMANKSNIGQIIYENINFSSLENFYLDNIYFYSE